MSTFWQSPVITKSGLQYRLWRDKSHLFFLFSAYIKMFYFCWGGRQERNSHFSLRVGESGSCHPSLTERGDGEYSVHPSRSLPKSLRFGVTSLRSTPRNRWGWDQLVTHESASARTISPISKQIFVWAARYRAYISAAFSRKERTCKPPLVTGLGSTHFLMDTPFHGVYFSLSNQTPTPWAPKASGSVSCALVQLWGWLSRANIF